MTAAPIIIVAEDETIIRSVVAETLRETGFEVIEKENADEVIAYLLICDLVDLVVTDIDMPGSMDGVALARHIRAHYPALKVILTSGGAKGPEATALGLFIPKPFILSDLVRTVQAALASQAP